MVKYGIEYHLVQVKCTMSITYHKTPAKEILCINYQYMQEVMCVCTYVRHDVKQVKGATEIVRQV